MLIPQAQLVADKVVDLIAVQLSEAPWHSQQLFRRTIAVHTALEL